MKICSAALECDSINMLNHLARRYGISRSELARIAIRDYFISNLPAYQAIMIEKGLPALKAEISPTIPPSPSAPVALPPPELEKINIEGREYIIIQKRVEGAK
jgi:hypothetical protein